MSNIPESSQEIAEKIKNGEFFRESMDAYHLNYHDPMSDRYLYIGITGLSLLIFIFAFAAIVAIYPLNQKIPLIYSVRDYNDIAFIDKLGSGDQDPNLLIKQFLTTNYLRLREEYDVEKVDRNMRGIRELSTPEVFAQYESQLDPRNPESPIAQFQRNAIRTIEPTGYVWKELVADDEQMEIFYTARIIAGPDVSAQRRRAIITFRFAEIEVDQDTGETTPMDFMVTEYRTEANN